MTPEEFEIVVETRFNRIRKVLLEKAKEYATEDRLHNFRTAAALEGVSMRQALGGMMAKHTVSIYDLIAQDDVAQLSVWDEKLTDHLNYLILLEAIVLEELGAGIDTPLEDFQFASQPKPVVHRGTEKLNTFAPVPRGPDESFA